MSHTRFAVYYLPPEGPIAEFGAAWLGWDVVRGEMVDQPPVTGINDVTMTPRKYGFHGTLKPPFRLVAGHDAASIKVETAALAATMAPGKCDGLSLSELGGFLALTPSGSTNEIERIAKDCVVKLDGLRAAAPEAELKRRRAAGLSTRQEELLTKWGYPYVLDEFRFHMTLSGKLGPEELAEMKSQANSIMPELPKPFEIDQIALVGERPDGHFELIERYALLG